VSEKIHAVHCKKFQDIDMNEMKKPTTGQKEIYRAPQPGDRTRFQLFLMGCAGTVLSIVALCSAGCSSESPAENLYERQLDGEVFETTPIRGAFRALRNRRTGFEYKCSECHNDFTSPKAKGTSKAEHAEITEAFEHGMNTRCQNCHHEGDRNAYVDHDGSPIPATNPARLCAKCHGPIYREWQIGTHGRQNGYWDANKGERTKLLCVQCHDPHQPAFKPMTPDPPPIRTRFNLEKPVHEAH
jgi:DNA-directed RNA polymerase subunit RPC12/RpoP